MNRDLQFTDAAEISLRDLASSRAQVGVFKQVRKTLGLLETNLRHPSLQTHPFHSMRGPSGEEVFEAYVQNKTPGAYRIFFYYGPDRFEGKKRIPVLTIVDIAPHP
jgi:hypothetical protein